MHPVNRKINIALESISLYELTDYIKQVIALNFTEAVWVHFEISQVNSSRGHWYLDCIETDANGNEIIAQLQATIWHSTYLALLEKHGSIIDDLLKSGVKINALVLVDYHTRYGLKIQIQDINPAFTIGEIELQRQALIQRLQDEGIFDYNRELLLPEVIRRIAVISSSRAAGYEDFKIHLRDNPYGYTFQTVLFEASMQGQHASREICDRLEHANTGDYDVVAILRGGGSKMDLSAFDSYEIAHKVAYMNIPVLTGIGHEKDISVTDLMANTALKTPTALANFIVDHNAAFEAEINQLANQIGDKAKQTIQQHLQGVINLSYQLKFSAAQQLNEQKSMLNMLSSHLRHFTQSRISSEQSKLDEMENTLHALDPSQILARGYSMSFINGKKITSSQKAAEGDLLHTVLHQGTITSKISSKND